MDIYHVLNRGVDKRNIFLDTADHARFVHDLFEFNDQKPAGSTYYSFLKSDLKNNKKVKDKELLVDIHSWCLMKNHYHLLISERTEGGLTKFIRKLNIGYAKYFNEKYVRSGTLFQGRTKKILVDSDAHFLFIIHYIHLNPLDFLGNEKEWRKYKIKNVERAISYLYEYRWSSFLDYCGEENFPSILQKRLYQSVFQNYKKEISEYVRDLTVTSIDQSMLLE